MLNCKKVKEMFQKQGLVFTKNEYNEGYSSTFDIGGGMVDQNNIITTHRSLEEAQKWIDNKIKHDKEISKKFYYGV